MENAGRLLNVGEAAEYLGVSAGSLRRWADQGLVPVYRTPGRQRRFVLTELDEFVSSMRETSAPAVPRFGRSANGAGG